MTVAVVVVTVILVLTNLANHYWLPRFSLLTCPLVAALLLVVGRVAGLSWTELGLGRRALLHGVLWAAAAAALVAAGYAVALARPGFREVTGSAPSTREALLAALVEVPFATVLLEETAFRGVLWGLLRHDHGAIAATAVSSLLFGLWHVAPTTGAAQGVHPPAWLARNRWAGPLWVIGTVLFTAVAGVLFCVLRIVSGSIVAPMGLHWATNGFGWLARIRAR